jgi:hypothetical protein
VFGENNSHRKRDEQDPKHESERSAAGSHDASGHVGEVRRCRRKVDQERFELGTISQTPLRRVHRDERPRDSASHYVARPWSICAYSRNSLMLAENARRPDAVIR